MIRCSFLFQSEAPSFCIYKQSCQQPWVKLIELVFLGGWFAFFSGKQSEQSVNFSERDSQTNLNPNRPHKIKRQDSMRFKHREPGMVKLETTLSRKTGRRDSDALEPTRIDGAADEVHRLKRPRHLTELASLRFTSVLDAAAIKVQKVYRSYRTRRNLADCAVVVEELWWKALDFAALKRSSFFDIKKPETAFSRWTRARTRAAKVGKGLSKDEKAQKLALRHWLEAIDPRHRYGHNLNLYYDVWFESASTQPFFYWLDIGDGKEENLKQCPRCDLQRQCIKYLGPKEREAYVVIVKNGKLIYRQSGMLLNTPEGSKWIFVLSTTRALYVGQKQKGTFQHSSFLAGGATIASGRLVAEEGVLKAIWPYSGHYLPTEENFKEFIGFLEEHNVDLSDVKRCATDDESPPCKVLEEPCRDEVVECPSVIDMEETSVAKVDASANETGSRVDIVDNVADNVIAPTFNLGKPLSCKWTSGTGPRIGIVRDYPPELQFKALEQVNLSPRITPSPIGNHGPIPSPRPSPKIRLSPRLAYMGLPSPRMAIPTSK